MAPITQEMPWRTKLAGMGVVMGAGSARKRA